MTFLDPLWLVLAIPLAAALWLWPPPSRILFVLRALVVALILLALAGFAIQLRSRAGVVVVVADRSLSMPPSSDATQRDVISALESKRGAESKLAVVSFGRQAHIEQADANHFSDFQQRIGDDGSNLHDGLETALSLVPRGAPGRIVVISDGRWTGCDPRAASLQAAARGVAIDYRVLARSSAADVAIERVDAPSNVSPGESFVIAAWIDSPRAQDIDVELLRGATTIAKGTHRLVSGTNRIAFRDRASSGGTLSYNVRVGPAQDDSVPENNRAKFLVGVSGPKPLLYAGSPKSRVPQLLAAGGLKIDAPPRADWTLESLSNYSAVLIENLPANDVGTPAMKTLASWVTNAGGGLMLTGGRSSYAAGGYFKSPLDPVLPVSMELRREHRKLNMAIVVAMDRSGSMAVPVNSVQTKMDLANISAVQVLDLLGPQDELGVVAVDSSAHIIADLDPIEGRNDLRSRILGVESSGGGIFIFEALSTAAKMLLTAQAQTRHIILFADAADSEEPGMYRELLEKSAQANITVSVIGLGKPTDVDADLLRDIAKRGGGRIFFTEDANELPRLFAQDTFIVARSTFIDTPSAVEPTGSIVSLTGRMFEGMPAVGGYNLSYLRDGATAAVLTRDEYHAPLVATWMAGAGRVLSYTGEMDGKDTGAIATWPETGNFFTSLARWTAGAAAPLPQDMLVTQHVDKGVCHIELQLDPERTTSPIVRLPRVTTLAGAPGGAPNVTHAEMTWRTPDELSLEIPLKSGQTYLSTVDVPGAGRVTLTPVVLPFSPELAPSEAGEGRRTLERLARATGGRERIAVADVWRDLPREKRHIPLRTYLLLAAVVLLTLEVLERRMRVFGLRRP
ncbi:MAG TPA: VWA domain-containing protein, partial [Thermoanaerobaculia bacterium]|nr:VWA domain-containing protein [Thermoanaerobaculia bacterium]